MRAFCCPSSYAHQLLSWYDKAHRVLPWRISPQHPALEADPYCVWLSEIMLQQTTVKTVTSYYLHFIKKWPTLSALAQAKQEDILKAWAGLGYYSRARNLHACAQTICAHYNGHFPRDLKQLQKLPGIGSYTASAICAIAFAMPVAVVDSNVERIITRLFCLERPIKNLKKQIHHYTQALTPTHHAGDFAQAMMDLGAQICTAKSPKCALCPVSSHCLANQKAKQHFLPIKEAKPIRPRKIGFAFVALSEKKEVFLKYRANKGLLAGMAEIPNVFDQTNTSEDDNQRRALQAAPFTANWQKCGQIQHVFTHFALTLEIYKASDITKCALPSGWWCPIEELPQQALPTLFKKAIACAIGPLG